MKAIQAWLCRISGKNCEKISTLRLDTKQYTWQSPTLTILTLTRVEQSAIELTAALSYTENAYLTS